MKRYRIVPGTRRRASSAFSLIEVAISIVIVGGMLVAALTTVAQSSRGLQRISEKARGTMLAQQLMAEILLLDYEEPVDTPGFGRESSESGGDRENYDDVDDYDGWASSPPQEKNGVKMDGYLGWARSVEVDWVSADDLVTVVGSETGAKRIIVVVKRVDAVRATLTAVRTSAADELRK